MIKTSWDFKSTLGYTSLNDPLLKKHATLAKQKAYQFITRYQKNKSYLTSVKSLYQALKAYDLWISNFSTSGNADYYLSLRQSLAENSSLISAKLNKLTFTTRDIENDIQFFLLNLSKIPQKDQKKFLNSSLLKPYKNFLKNLFAHGQHLLTDDQEKIINLKSQVSYGNWVKMTSRLLSQSARQVLDIDKKTKTMSFSKISSLVDYPEFPVASSAATAFTDIVDQLADVAESELNSVLEDKYIEDRLRLFDRPDSARLLSDDIPPVVVDTMVSTVTKNFQLSRDYYKFKAKLLKRSTIPYFWKTVSLSKSLPKYSINKSIAIVDQTLKDLDPNYSKIFQEFLAKGQIDFLPKIGKTDGAFCSSGMLTSKTFILLNHTGRLRDLTTLAHEMGHALNNEYSRTCQNGLNFGTSLATAEVSSTFFENFVLENIKKGLSSEDLFNLTMTRLDDEVSTIFRQVACYNFQKELHLLFRQKGYLSKKTIGQLFIKHMHSYLGDSVDLSGFSSWWVYWSHLRDPFYVYSYASGLLISKRLQSLTKKNPKFINQVNRFLSSGTSRSPQAIFKSIGLDISKPDFWQSGLNAFKKDLNQSIRNNAV